MPFPFAAIAAAVIPKLVGGILGNKSAKDQNRKAGNQAGKDYARDLAQYKKAKANDRAYAHRVTKRDRAYAEKTTAKDRKYAEGLAAKDRKLNLADEARRLAEYKADRSALQKTADKYAERTTASRGIDFQKMRDEAVAAGFNPLTAMQFAQSYSTEVGYNVVGGPASGQGSAQATPAVGTPVVGSQAAPAQAFQAPGNGYGSVPAFTSNAFIGDALGAGVDSYFNAVAEDKATYENIAAQVAIGQIERYQRQHDPSQNFGFDLSKVAPYQPDITAGRSDMIHPDQFTTALGFDLPLTPNRTEAQDWSDRYGDVVEDAAGIGLLGEDVGRLIFNKTREAAGPFRQRLSNSLDYWGLSYPEAATGSAPLRTPLARVGNDGIREYERKGWSNGNFSW